MLLANFIYEVCLDLERNPTPGGLDVERDFMYDNLSAHLSPYVTQTLELRDSQIRFVAVPRSLYQPKYGPTEYIFCYLAGQLPKEYQLGWNLENMQLWIEETLANFGCDGINHELFRHALGVPPPAHSA